MSEQIITIAYPFLNKGPVFTQPFGAGDICFRLPSDFSRCRGGLMKELAFITTDTIR